MAITYKSKLISALLLVVLLIAAGRLFTLDYTGDIGDMLPDTKGSFREDFELLRYAPLTRKIMIDLEFTGPSSTSDNDADLLVETAGKLSTAMTLPFFSRVVHGIAEGEEFKLFNWLFDHWPLLFTETDILALEEKLSDQAIAGQLQDNMKLLNSPESIVLKKLILRDPIALREPLLAKLRYLNLIPEIELHNGHFLSKDHRHTLIIVETTVEITDFEQSQAMLDHLGELIKEHLPETIKARIICGHRYTVANASTIQNDLVKVLLISTLGLVAIFIIFLRSRYSIIVFMIPGFALIAGVTATSLFFPAVSAITVGFGAVLLGISVDFGLHVYFAVRYENESTLQIISKLTRPLLFCAMTTTGVFAVLLFSALPGQRQLAVFSIAGIITAFLLALWVLPNLLAKSNDTLKSKLVLAKSGKSIALIWLIVMVIAAVCATGIEFDGRLRNVSVVPDGIIEDENVLKATWGDSRDRAMVFSLGSDIQEAMSVNDRLFENICHDRPDLKFLSIASIMPSKTVQMQNLQRWNNFWGQNDNKTTLKKSLYKNGKKLGLKAAAFEPFLKWIDHPADSFGVQTFSEECSSEMVEPFVVQINNLNSVITLVPDTDEVINYFNGYKDADVKVVSQKQFGIQLDEVTISDFTRFLTGAIVLTISLLIVLFRDIRKILLCLLPVISGIISMLAIMSLAGLKLNIFNIVAAILVTGLGVDYGIFILFALINETKNTAIRAVVVSSLTTFAGFGSLIAARHPAMNSIGVTVACGIVAAAFCAVVVMPSAAALLGIETKSRES